jgi:peptidoglycan/xylan/chitin deacetylase (PgdA/CDA1 family)
MNGKIYRILRRMTLLLLPNTKVIFKENTDKKVIYLTFDDGPNVGYTSSFLALLDKFSVKATFFLVGECVNENFDIAKSISDKGHYICNHTMEHNDFSKLSSVDQIKSVMKLNSILNSIDGVAIRHFRPPRGEMTFSFIAKMLKIKVPIAMWSRDSLDYQGLCGEEIFRKFELSTVSNGDVILFHDDNNNSLDALKLLLPYWIERGYQFDTLKRAL